MGSALSHSSPDSLTQKTTASGFELEHHKAALLAGTVCPSSSYPSSTVVSVGGQLCAAVKVMWDRKDSPKISNKTLSAIFSGYGDVTSIRISRTMAVVKFRTIEQAKAALRENNNPTTGNNLRVVAKDAVVTTVRVVSPPRARESGTGSSNSQRARAKDLAAKNRTDCLVEVADGWLKLMEDPSKVNAAALTAI